MSLADGYQASSDLDVEQEMAELGITRVPVDYFHYREFRYTNLKDAIAQARRGQALQSSSRPAEALLSIQHPEAGSMRH